ncbi:MAG: S41 family peptidase [Chloroflexota bacterium]|nr:S41 family peptidase [Chloroflexota bacterium]
MNRMTKWRPPLWMVVVLMGCTLALGTGAGYVQGAASNSAGFISGGPNTGQCTESAEVCSKFSNFWEVWNIAEERFLDPKALNSDDMITGAINGMLDSLNDRGHTRYQTAEEFERMQESLQGEFEGIGAYIGTEGEYPTVTAPIEGSPAEAAGIKAGDIILSVNGESTRGLELEEVVNKVRGKPGTTVTLEIQHLDQEAPVELTVTRAAVNVPAVTWRMLPGKVGLIKLSQFQEKATAELKRALKEAKEQGAEKLILDVRNNPGGLLNQAVSVTSQFLPEGEVLLRVRERDGTEDVYKTNESNPETELPVVVLINQGSASSAEIFSGALQDYGRAKLIGVQTPGAGSVLSPFQLDDGSAVYLGTAEWLTPKGRQIRNEGIEPDITVSLPLDVYPLTPTTAKDLSVEEIRQTEDTQIQRAYEELGVDLSTAE